MKRRNILKSLLGIPAAVFVAGKVKGDTIISTEGITSGSGITGRGVTGRVAVFNSPYSDGEILAPGCFNPDDLIHKPVRFLNHDSEKCLGKVSDFSFNKDGSVSITYIPRIES